MDATEAAAVLARARQGDSEAFCALVERHSRSVFRLAFRMTGNEQDAEDVVQETFLRAYKQLGRFESRAGFGTWLHRIAANCSLDLLRRQKRRDDRERAVEFDAEEFTPAVLSDAPSPDQQVFHVEVRQKVESAMRELTPMERTAFVLRHFEGRSIEEIGNMLGAGPGAAKQSIFRAVQKMRRALEPLVNAIP